MNGTVKLAENKVETYDYKSDFLLLPLGERRAILKNAKNLLKLQRENNILLVGVPLPQNENEKFQ